jgi:hypothetical protein
MNKYGTLALVHWRRFLPLRFSQIDDPDSFFSDLGEQIETRIQDLSLQLQGDDPPGEDFLAKLGRLNMARLNAESQALQELALLEPEADATPAS